jgi:hypothetical protein
MFYILDVAGGIVRTATTVPDMPGIKEAGQTVVESDFALGINDVEVKGFPDKPVIVGKRAPVVPSIVLNTTAQDTDGDGLPELFADGKSKASLTVFLHDLDGSLLKKSVQVGFRVTAGAISKRQVKTTQGKATVDFTAGQETVTAMVFAFADGYAPAYLRFELVPPTK